MQGKFPYSYVLMMLGLLALAFLEISPERLVVGLGTLICFLVFWFLERQNFSLYNPHNANIERFEQSMTTLGEYDREYTNWLGSRHGQSVTLGFAKFASFVMLVADIYAHTFYSFKLISPKLIGGILLPLLGFNFGMGY